MSIGISDDCYIRYEEFGAFCYVHSRNDFFAVGKALANIFHSIESGEKINADISMNDDLKLAITVGILKSSSFQSESYSSPSLIGLDEVPSIQVGKLLVVNCFSTAFCPLRCVYCHADDLMTKERQYGESKDGLLDSIRSAKSLDSMVYVITGGDPITKPDRAAVMIEELASTDKPIVLDTSGVGEIEGLLDVIVKHNVHVRVSLDSFNHEINTRTRPLDKRVIKTTNSSFDLALKTIRTLQANGVYITIQTVLTTKNSGYNHLLSMRDSLLKLGIKNWVLHNLVVAGKMAKSSKKAAEKGKSVPLKSSQTMSTKHIKPMIQDTVKNKLPIDIRYTEANLAKNCVVLISNAGEVFTEGNHTAGKKTIATPSEALSNKFNWYLLNGAAHSSRYLNCEIWR